MSHNEPNDASNTASKTVSNTAPKTETNPIVKPASIKDLLALFIIENEAENCKDFSEFLSWLVKKDHMNAVLEINDNQALSLKIQSLLQYDATELKTLLSSNDVSLSLLTSNTNNDSKANSSQTITGTEVFIHSANIGRLKKQ